MRILFITSTRIGDAVLSTGLLSHLIARHPGARITVACGAGPAPLFAAVPGLERVIPLVKQRFSGHWLALWRHCVMQRWDIVIDLRRSGIGYALWARHRHVLPRTHGPVHKVFEVAATLELGLPPAPRLWFDAPMRHKAAELIPAGGPVLALGPTANWAPKTWPADRFAELARRLTGENGILPDARIAVFGAPAERAAAAPVIAAIRQARRIDLVGAADLAIVGACLARCALYIGNDSGLMHMAAAAGTPTLGLFGPSPPARYAPWGARTAVAATTVPYEDLVGAPGFDHRDTKCLMATLTVDRAEMAARELWQRCQDAAA